MNNKRNIAIITHKNCDVDAVLSTLSLKQYLIDILGSEKVKVFAIMEKHEFAFQIKLNASYYTSDEVDNIIFDSVIVCDVNEKDRLYGLSILNSVNPESRYLLDHHDGNREELEIPSKNRIINPNASATCEIIADMLIKKGYTLSSDMAHDLFLGIASDTACFQRSTSEQTLKIAETLISDSSKREELQKELSKPTEKQMYLLNLIKQEQFGVSNTIFFKLTVPKDMGDITKLLKHPIFDQLISPTEENQVSIFVMEVDTNYFVKLRKGKTCNLDILSIAESYHSGGHADRCAARFYNTIC